MPLWQTDPAWRDNRIASTARGAMFARWLFAVAFIGFSAPLVLVLPKELAVGNWPVLIAVLFPLVGLGMLYSAIVRTLEWRRVGRLALVLDPFPGSLGGDVGGTIEATREAGGSGSRWRAAGFTKPARVTAGPPREKCYRTVTA